MKNFKWKSYPVNSGVTFDLPQLVSLHYSVESVLSTHNTSQLLESDDEFDVSLQAFSSVDPLLSRLDDTLLTWYTINYTDIKLDSNTGR